MVSLQGKVIPKQVNVKLHNAANHSQQLALDGTLVSLGLFQLLALISLWENVTIFLLQQYFTYASTRVICPEEE